MFCWHGTRDGFWFRVYGYGLVVSNARPYFSERNGFVRVLRIGRWGISVLRPRVYAWDRARED